jgi:isoleucyl-tRNA synthetase
MSEETQTGKDKYKKSLNLPKTKFSMRANLVQNEPRFQKYWSKIDLYKTILGISEGRERFIFHDGPPYANGSIHMGHLLNKVLKDLVVRTKTMAGYHVEFVPGWDCHGLPIEHKVMQELGGKARDMTALEIRQKCKSYASKQVRHQAKQMQALGTVGDYDKPYLTMIPAYEGGVLDVFADLVEQGLVFRTLKPVNWSIANQTALAEAELEYKDREDTSIYVFFNLTNPDALPGGLPEGVPGASIMIWTTTPWTLPANRGVALSERDSYGLYSLELDGDTYHTILGEELHEKVFQSGGATNVQKLATYTGAELAEAGLTYKHPITEGLTCPVVTADYVTMSDGTGAVHTAPGHGVEDFQTGQKFGLEVYCPVRSDGTYDNTVPEWLQGKSVWVANEEVVEYLKETKQLFYAHKFMHSYPHDWRSKTPTIFRATHQWFVGVDRPLKDSDLTLRQLAQRAADEEISFIPEWGRNRLSGMLESRPDWCVSRQRSWGLPIPAFYNADDEALLTTASVRAISDQLRKKGSDFWFKAESADLLADYDVQADPDAPAWAKEEGVLATLRKSNDIFDVWFESGTSWNAVLNQRGLGYPADLYLEGSDQHRGWFQLSLLPSLGANQVSPFKKVLTHGFIVDKGGYKMSKSLGNAISVEELLKKHGADVCRWWVSSLNYLNDIKADWAFFQTASEEYRKIRNTIRFLLGNLSDFNPETDRVEMGEEDLFSLDAWAERQLSALVKEVLESYEEYQFRRGGRALFDFCNTEMSAVYMASTKDRLYCEASDSRLRRRIQTVMYDTLQALLRLLSPILVHTTEEIFQIMQGTNINNPKGTVHTLSFPERFEPLAERLGHEGAEAEWELVFGLRERVLKALEEARNERGINYPLDAGIVATVTEADFATLQKFSGELADLAGVSRFALVQGAEASVEVQDLTNEPRCVRSWKRDETVQLRSDGNYLTDRDAAVAEAMGLL